MNLKKEFLLMSRYFRKLNLMSSFLCLILLSATFIASAAIEQKWQQVSGGYSFTVAIKSDGSLWAWGYNSSGQLGSGDNVDSDIPQKIGNDTNWQSIAAGDRHVLATKTDGTLWTWGENTFGQLGLNSRTLQFTTPQQVFTDTDWQKVTGGNTHSLAMKSNGTLGAWGSRSSGKLGDGNTSNGLSRFPVQVGSDDNWLNVSASQAHTLAVKTDGTLWAWGDNGNGQLGDGSESDTYNPVQIGTDTNWLDVSAGSFNSLGLKSDGTLWAWGSNFFGALGLGEDTSKRLIPHRIGLDNDWQSMVASFAHVLAIKTDGSLWSWGDNNDGQLGNGTIGDEVFPEQVGSERNWQHVSTSLSSGHSLAIKLDGSLWAWGNNEDGQLGIGNRLETLNRHQVLVKESDVDNDGIVDSEDAFPSIAIGDLMDTDNDGAPDECDTDCQTSGMSADADDDNDDVLDTVDAFPLDATESVDTDLDGIGNNADNDDDNDGLPDTYELANDLNPLDVLDAAQDEDSDGLSNSEEFALGTNINLADSDADGIADNVDTNPLVFDAVNEMLYSGQIAILPDINGDNVQ
jgi:alpha-tubulin suppressor-like RCC1 family protein